jgi:hypothetical protein
LVILAAAIGFVAFLTRGPATNPSAAWRSAMADGVRAVSGYLESVHSDLTLAAMVRDWRSAAARLPARRDLLGAVELAKVVDAWDEARRRGAERVKREEEGTEAAVKDLLDKGRVQEALKKSAAMLAAMPAAGAVGGGAPPACRARVGDGGAEPNSRAYGGLGGATSAGWDRLHPRGHAGLGEGGG